MGALFVRPIDRAVESELELVAHRMRATLVEVLGEARGVALYTLDWLRDRARWHLDPSCTTGEIFVADDGRGQVLGHTIVRVDEDERGAPIGLFSTTYVEPSSRRSGIADALVTRGEAWMRERGMALAVTDTSATNERLIALFAKRGYRIVHRADEMVRLAKLLEAR